MHIQDNAGGGAVLGKCSRRKESLERVASTGRASTKGRSGGAAVLSVRGEWLCSLCDIYVCGSGQYKVQCFKYTLCIYTYKWFVLCV